MTIKLVVDNSRKLPDFNELKDTIKNVIESQCILEPTLAKNYRYLEEIIIGGIEIDFPEWSARK